MLTQARLAVRQSLSSLNPGDQVVVAVSGGADSLLLAHCLKIEGSELALVIHAVVIDHQLQENSNEVALQAKQTLNDLGINEVTIIQVNVEKRDGIEADARKARYDALNSYAKKIGAAAIFLGHNEDDLAESVLLGLTQGSGTKSLAGMAEQEIRENGLLYLRPFLTLTRDEIEKGCAESRISFWSDPHNQDERFTRVKIRRRILPLMESEIGPGIKAALARSARIFREDSQALDSLATEVFSAIADPTSIDIELLEPLPGAVRKRVIRTALASLGASRVSAEQLGWVDALISQWHGQKEVALPAGVTARRESGRLALSKEQP